MVSDREYIKLMASAAVEKRQEKLINNDEMFGFLDSLCKPIPNEIPDRFEDENKNWKLL